jgi:hypothetical protein
LNIGWHLPSGPRQNPGPHPSATLITKLLALPTRAGVTAALAAVARPKTNETTRKVVLIILYSSLLRLNRNDLPIGSEIDGDGTIWHAKSNQPGYSCGVCAIIP